MLIFDDIMKTVGNHSRYQRWVLAFIICPTSFLAGMTVNILLFQVPVPDHWCHVPGRENTSYSVDEWRNMTIPVEGDKFSSCKQYTFEWKEGELVTHNDTQACVSGWDHDKSEFQTTLATTNEWYCERKSYSDHVYSITTAGYTVGTSILPIIADRYLGRRRMFFVALAIYITFTVPVIFVSNYGFHLVLRFLAALSFETNYMMPYVTGLEFLAPELRTVATLVSFVSWTFAMCFTSLIAWLVPNWQHLALISCVPSVLAFTYWWFLPESPRWLLSQGRIYECATVLLQVAKSNGKDLSRVQLESDLHLLWNQQEKEVSLLEVLRYPVLRMRAAILFILGAGSFMAYGVVFLGVTELASNIFVSHFVVSISELPSNALGWVWAHFLGRRFTSVASFILAATFMAAAPFCHHDKWLMLAVVSIIRLFTTQLIYIVFVQCTEIFPTPVRSVGLAWMMVCGLAMMITTPYLLRSGISENFPYWLLFGLMLFCALLGTFLPETLGLPLPQTFQDAEDLGNGRPITAWVHHWNQHKFPVAVSSQENRYKELRQLSLTDPKELKKKNLSSETSGRTGVTTQ